MAEATAAADTDSRPSDAKSPDIREFRNFLLSSEAAGFRSSLDQIHVSVKSRFCTGIAGIPLSLREGVQQVERTLSRWLDRAGGSGFGATEWVRETAPPPAPRKPIAAEALICLALAGLMMASGEVMDLCCGASLWTWVAFGLALIPYPSLGTSSVGVRSR